MSYFEEKVKRYYKLFKKNQPILKTYAVVEKDGRFLVLSTPQGKDKYCLAGGSVDKGETTQTAIVRELKEELNVNAQVVKSLGFIKYTSHWNYKGTEFDINNVAEIFYTKFVGHTNGTQVGLDGEFKPDVSVLEISKQEMIENVAEFTKFGIKLD